MKDEDLNQIIEALNKTFDSRDRIDAITHKMHHDQYELDLEDRKIKRERWEAIKRQVLGWGIIVLLTTIGTAVYKTFFK